MGDPNESTEIGKELAALLDQLPPEERRRFRYGIARLIHDMRQSIGIIFTAEVLLRRRGTVPTSEIELLDTINTASRRVMHLLTGFAKPFDDGVSFPAPQRPPALDNDPKE